MLRISVFKYSKFIADTFIFEFGEITTIYGSRISTAKVWIKVCNVHSAQKPTELFAASAFNPWLGDTGNGWLNLGEPTMV